MIGAPHMLALLLALAANGVSAQSLAPTRTLAARAIIDEADLAVLTRAIPGTITDPEALLGQETRRILYAGRPIRPGDVGPPAVVERNQPVSLLFQSGAIEITAEGRALGRAGIGEELRAMNLGSRNIVLGVVTAAGQVRVLP